MRDYFPKRVKNNIRDRVGNLCSKPDCRALTSGPQVDPAKALHVGVAAHITAASPSGARYDDSLTREKRRSDTNAIWLCQTHGKEIDDDPNQFTVEVIRKWKDDAEKEALERIGKTHASLDTLENKRSLLIDRAEYYQVSEVAQRLQVPDDRIYQWGMTGEMILSFIYHRPTDYIETRYEKDAQGNDIKITKTRETLLSIRSENTSNVEIVYLHPRDARRVILNNIDEREILVSDLFFTADLIPQKAKRLLNCPIGVSKQELIVTKEEFQRFAAENTLPAI